MTYTIKKPIYTQRGRKSIWLEPGSYEIVRWFDGRRVMIELPHSPDTPRLVTIVPIRYGLIE